VPLPDGRTLRLGERTLVMGILNVTPDSFADGGDRLDPDVAIAAALGMAEAGADLIDLGGESTRPGAPPLPEAEEWRRVAPVLEELVSAFSAALVNSNDAISTSTRTPSMVIVKLSSWLAIKARS